MGKRSRMVDARRKHDRESLHRRAMLYLRAAAFCCIAAKASEKEGTRTVIAWINEFFCMSEGVIPSVGYIGIRPSDDGKGKEHLRQHLLNVMGALYDEWFPKSA